MPTLKEVEFYLTGLWLLFKQDPKGFAYLDLSDRGMMRSFFAILWALPAILISFVWWRLLFLQTEPELPGGAGVFFFRLSIIEGLNWMLPLVMVGLLCWIAGLGAKFSSLIVVANWLTLPISYCYGALILIMMLLPGLSGLVALMWLILMLTLIAALFRILRMVLGDHTLTIATTTMVLLVPTMIISEMLERYLGVFPG
ncbi:hypothetical protein FE840_006555 [Peteryoungia desertarenae]|uniref:Yip1 domain-containing protein n=1 Tax=Peteryoungia desertarenae TaxID=1813451 RepID=A0ABX6QKZ2_9HYPH|nr:hypothetical protein [Peteryoungia desertarenae]QLF69229.1 hypothetical protein FE840_006555 [Peteryoungia desertarenae]